MVGPEFSGSHCFFGSGVLTQGADHEATDVFREFVEQLIKFGVIGPAGPVERGEDLSDRIITLAGWITTGFMVISGIATIISLFI